MHIHAYAYACIHTYIYIYDTYNRALTVEHHYLGKIERSKTMFASVPSSL